MLSMRERSEFVLLHPYRAWYPLKLPATYIGSIYLLRSNSIGVSVKSPYEQHIPSALNQLKNKYAPLPAIKSVRAAVFSINVAPANNALISIINEMRGELSQHTYARPSHFPDPAWLLAVYPVMRASVRAFSPRGVKKASAAAAMNNAGTSPARWPT